MKDLIELMTKKKLDVDPHDIVSGTNPKNTNLFLQGI